MRYDESVEGLQGCLPSQLLFRATQELVRILTNYRRYYPKKILVLMSCHVRNYSCFFKDLKST